jgi:hypothetical protein
MSRLDDLLPWNWRPYQLITGRSINFIPDDRIVEMTEEELAPLINIGAKRVD